MSRRPLAGRELWRIGDWGGASGYIGRRWEEVGAAALGKLVGKPSANQPDFISRAAISFVQDSALEQAVQGAGLTHADALLLGPHAGRLAIQPVDFKWSLEVARPEQVAGETLLTLLEAEVPAIRAVLRSSLDASDWGRALVGEAGPSPDQLDLLDGLFLAPDHAANRGFLDSPINHRQDRPLTRREVALEPVDGREFFAPLPGWELAQTLAGQEGARRALDTLEGAEHYYRLGAGIMGALSARQHSIFDPSPPAIDAHAELANLRRVQRLTTTELIVGYLDRAMRARSELKKAFSQLGRQVFPFGAYRGSLKAAGITFPERSETANPEARRWSGLYGLVQRELTVRLSGEGRELVANGLNDAQAVAALSGRGPEFAREAATITQRLIALEHSAELEIPLE